MAGDQAGKHAQRVFREQRGVGENRGLGFQPLGEALRPITRSMFFQEKKLMSFTIGLFIIRQKAIKPASKRYLWWRRNSHEKIDPLRIGNCQKRK